MTVWKTVAVFAAAYLLGAIPFGVIAAKICGVDIFRVGSGSTGTTNVIRACGKRWGLAVFILDMLKGTLATCLGKLVFPLTAAATLPVGFFGYTHITTAEYPNNAWLIVFCGVLAIIGHSVSIFIRFRGGKSAATGLGIALALDWRIFLLVALITLLIRQITGYQSVATLAAGLISVILFWIFSPYLAYQLLTTAAVAFIWVKHIPNIKRLLNGTETKITGNKNG